jgi:hypothetical protein
MVHTDAADSKGQPAPTIRLVGRADLSRIAERYKAAERAAFTAGIYNRQGDREAAEAESQAAAAEFWAAESELADLLLMLLRLALRHQPDALRDYLTEALRPELEALADGIAELEGRR